MDRIISFNKNEIILNADGRTSRVEILKVGVVHDRGFKVTDTMLDDFIKNFNEGVYGTEIQVNLGHKREDEAAGWIKGLVKKNGVLFADVEWTPLGVEKISSKQFRYTSSELSLSYPHYKTGNKVKNVLTGVALTNIPAVKGMNPVTLSENLQLLFLNSNSMNDKAKKMYSELMDKEAITEEEMAAFEKEAGETDDATEAKKKLSEKVKKVTKKEDPKEQLAEKDNKQFVSLAEYKREKEERIKLQEKIEKMELNEFVETNLLLSEKNRIGFARDFKDRLVNYLIGKSEEDREELLSMIKNGIQTVDLSTNGNINAGDAADKDDAEEVVKKAKKEAIELSEKTGRPLHECLSELLSQTELANK